MAGLTELRTSDGHVSRVTRSGSAGPACGTRVLRNRRAGPAVVLSVFTHVCKVTSFIRVCLHIASTVLYFTAIIFVVISFHPDKTIE